MLWLIFALLTAFAVLSVLWPLLKTPRGLTHGATDIALYKAQLAEIDRDAAQGFTTPEDVEAAKAEAARRLMAAAEASGEPTRAERRWVARSAVAGAAIIAPVLALGLYWTIGKPSLPDSPLSARLETSLARNEEIAAAVQKIEAHLQQNPDDGRGYDVLAPVYLRMGRMDDALRAFAAAFRLLGETPERLSRYGEALVVAANGDVTAEAREAFEKASAKDPSLVKPRFFQGLAAEQDGDFARAREIWGRLVADSPEAAPWRQALEARMAALPGGAAAGDRDEPGSKPGLAAKIQAMSEAERATAIRGMVDGLAARLAQNGQDLEGWLRLVRAYAVLHESEKARSAVIEAKRNLAGDAPAIARIDALARELGLEG